MTLRSGFGAPSPVPTGEEEFDAGNKKEFDALKAALAPH